MSTFYFLCTEPFGIRRDGHRIGEFLDAAAYKTEIFRMPFRDLRSQTDSPHNRASFGALLSHLTGTQESCRHRGRRLGYGVEWRIGASGYRLLRMPYLIERTAPANIFAVLLHPRHSMTQCEAPPPSHATTRAPPRRPAGPGRYPNAAAVRNPVGLRLARRAAHSPDIRPSAATRAFAASRAFARPRLA